MNEFRQKKKNKIVLQEEREKEFDYTFFQYRSHRYIEPNEITMR